VGPAGRPTHRKGESSATPQSATAGAKRPTNAPVRRAWEPAAARLPHPRHSPQGKQGQTREERASAGGTLQAKGRAFCGAGTMFVEEGGIAAPLPLMEPLQLRAPTIPRSRQTNGSPEITPAARWFREVRHSGNVLHDRGNPPVPRRELAQSLRGAPMTLRMETEPELSALKT
jgi:hypothetical protein